MQTPLSIVAHENVVVPVGLSDTHTVESERFWEQENANSSGIECIESCAATGVLTDEEVISTPHSDVIAKISQDAKPSNESATRELVHVEDTNQSRSGQGNTNQRDCDGLEHHHATTKGKDESANTGQPEQQSDVVTVPTTIATSRQHYLKLMFWKRYKTSRNKGSSEDKLPVQVQAPRSSMAAADHVVPPSIVPSVSKTESMTATPPVIHDTTSMHAPTTSIHAITVPIDSPSIYLLEDGTYVGKLGDLSPPATAEATWLSSTRQRLITDLRPVLISLPKSLSQNEEIIELELCMSGRVDAALDTVQLSPSIWIRCGSKRCRDDIRKAVADLSYLRPFQVHLRLGAPRFVCHMTRCPASVIRRTTELPTSSGHSGLSPGAITGIIIGICAAFLAIFTGILFLYWKRRRQSPIASSVSNLNVRPARSAKAATPCFHGHFKNVLPFDPIYEMDCLKEVIELNSAPPLQATSDDHDNTEIVADDSHHGTKECSTCGLKLEVEVDEANEKLSATSIIGGLIYNSGNVYGLTTAHSIIELLPFHD
jgi:hypothetical protein